RRLAVPQRVNLDCLPLLGSHQFVETIPTIDSFVPYLQHDVVSLKTGLGRLALRLDVDDHNPGPFEQPKLGTKGRINIGDVNSDGIGVAGDFPEELGTSRGPDARLDS